MAPKSVLLFGATGYIGGAFLSNLHAKLGSKLGESFRITLASRGTEKARKIQALIPGSTAIELSLQDLVGLEEQSQKHDIIIQMVCIRARRQKQRYSYACFRQTVMIWRLHQRSLRA